MNTISFKTKDSTKEKLDFLASQQNRDRSFIINQALDYYISLYEWQMAHIQKGVKQAENNEFADAREVQAAFDKWKR